MHGNVWTWCQESFRAYPEGSVERPVRDAEDLRDVVEGQSRVLRGASFLHLPTYVRTAYRYHYRPSDRYDAVGLRVARTCD
jgi:formylglycine-generating enzyme required for sulfatase activity